MSDINNMTPEDKNLYRYLNLCDKRSLNALTEEEKAEMNSIASSESRANEIEETFKKVLTQEAGIDEYNTLYEMYKQELKATYGDLDTKPVDKDTQIKIVEYLNLEAKRSEGPLTDEENRKINEYLSIEEVKVLEEAHKKLANKEMTVGVLKEVREKYKNNVLENLKSIGVDTTNIVIEDKKLYEEQAEVKLSKDTQDIIDYFKIEVKRVKGDLTQEENDKLKKLGFSSSKVMALEETHKRIDNKKLPLNVLKILRNKYKAEAVAELESKGLNPADYFEDDSVLYSELKEYENTPIAPEELAKSMTQKEENAPVEPAPVEPMTAAPDPAKPVQEATPSEAPVENKETIEDLLNKEDQASAPAESPVPAETSPVETVPEPEVETLSTPLQQDPNNIEEIGQTAQEALIEDSNSQGVSEVVSVMDSEKVKALEEENKKLKELVEKLQNQLDIKDGLDKLPQEFKELKRYFELDDKRRTNEITKEEIKEIRLLTKDSTNPMIEEIESIFRKYVTDEYDSTEFTTKHSAAQDKYRKLLQEEIEKCKENK